LSLLGCFSFSLESFSGYHQLLSLSFPLFLLCFHLLSLLFGQGHLHHLEIILSFGCLFIQPLIIALHFLQPGLTTLF